MRFDTERVLGEWSTLVNPGSALPYALRELTGLDDETLASAPSLESVMPRLLDFVGDCSLVGQSVDMDLLALRRQGFQLRNPWIDTFELATVVLPGLSSYDLLAEARALGVDVAERHRALADAQLAREVFLALRERIHAAGLDVLMHVNRVTAAFDWPLRSVFVEAEREAKQRAFGSPQELSLGLLPALRPPQERAEPLV